jgi:hypothetical protein
VIGTCEAFLPGDPGNVGEQYGRDFERPLVTAVSPAVP